MMSAAMQSECLTKNQQDHLDGTARPAVPLVRRIVDKVISIYELRTTNWCVSCRRSFRRRFPQGGFGSAVLFRSQRQTTKSL